jgi:hypothetical protein
MVLVVVFLCVHVRTQTRGGCCTAEKEEQQSKNKRHERTSGGRSRSIVPCPRPKNRHLLACLLGCLEKIATASLVLPSMPRARSRDIVSRPMRGASSPRLFSLVDGIASTTMTASTTTPSSFQLCFFSFVGLGSLQVFSRRRPSFWIDHRAIVQGQRHVVARTNKQTNKTKTNERTNEHPAVRSVVWMSPLARGGRTDSPALLETYC